MPVRESDQLVSVIVPSFNAQATLEETLASIAAQSHARIEILIVDDGSTDATAAIATGFCQRDSRARLIRKANGGVASARNLGIAQAKGSFVAPIDADDLWHPDHLDFALAEMRRTNSAMAFSWYRAIDTASKVLRSGPMIGVDGRALHRMAYSNVVGNGSSLVVEREVALAVGGYDERLRAAGAEGCEDYLIQLRIAAAYPIACVPRFHVGYRSRPDAMSADAERMCRSNRMAIGLFVEATGAQVPSHLWRWNRARDHMRLARFRSLRGRLPGAVLSGLAALRLDPGGTLAAVHYDLRRVASRLWRGKGASPGTSFLEADPVMPIGSPRIGRPDQPHLIERLERARMRHAAELDGLHPPQPRHAPSCATLETSR